VHSARRVVVTGLGVVAPLGNDLDSFWSGLLAGRSGIDQIRRFESKGFVPPYAGEVKEFQPEQYFDKRKVIKMAGRHTQLAMAAARMSFSDARLTAEGLDAERFGIVFGTGMLRADLADIGQMARMSRGADGRFDLRLFGAVSSSKLFPLWMLRHIPNMVSSQVAISLNAQGPSNTITTTCTAGAQAIGEASRIIERGDADVIISGGSDARVDPLSLVRLRKLGLLAICQRDPQEVSRPFDIDSSGMVCAEGAAALVLEELEHARARGARIYAEVVGYGTATDAYDLVYPHPEGRGLQLAINRALTDAHLSPEAVGYINAHGASIPRYDLAEARALKTAFGKHAMRLAASSIKSMIGHAQAASGAIEAVACVKTLETGMAPPTINLRRMAPGCDLDWVPNSARQLAVEVAMSINFGFGGYNTALIFKRWSGGV